MDNIKQICVELANLAKREHYFCEDSWYSCPKAEGGCANDAEGDECTCGADAHNAKVNELLAAALVEPEPDPEEIKKWLMTNCVFSGMPPAPYRAWNEWAEAVVSAKVIQGVHIKAFNPPCPAAAPAEPEPEGPTLDEIDDLCAEHSFCYEDRESLECLLLIITDALARWGNHSTPQPADGEVAELVAWMKNQVTVHEVAQTQWVKRFVRAASLLERLSPPQPVPVSERWPEFSDCDNAERVWCWNWRVGAWRLSQIDQGIHSHWLPAHALPMPSYD